MHTLLTTIVTPDSFQHIISTTWAPGYRASRIESLIKNQLESRNVTLEDATRIQLDQISHIFIELKPILSSMDPNGFTKYPTASIQWLKRVLSWNGDTNVKANLEEAAVFETW